MPQQATTLRAARPTREEGRMYARYLDQAAEGFFRFMLGPRAVDIIAKAFTEPGHDLSYQHVTFAERDGEIVGMVSGYTAAQHRRSTDRPLKQAAGGRHLRLSVVSTLFAPLMRIIDTIGDDDFYLPAIAVDEAHRGEGVGSVLMDAIEAQGVASGSARLVLDVSGKNEGARKLYERRGMTVESRWPRRLAVPGLSFVRMTKAL